MLRRRTSASASCFRSRFGGSRVLVAFLYLLVIGVPLAHVALRIHQRLTLYGEIAHACRRKLAFTAEDALRILAARELDRLRRARKEQLVAAKAVLRLDHHGLPANHVRRSVQQQRAGHASGQRAIDRLIGVVECVNHAHVRNNRRGGFVHVIAQRHVRVRIDNAWRKVFPAGIDYRHARRSANFVAEGSDLAVLYIDAAIRDLSVRDREQRGVLDKDVFRRGGRAGCLRDGGRNQQQLG